MKVRLVVINLEGKALQWHQNWSKFKRGNEAVTWEAYVQALEERFGEHNGQDPMAELLALKQTGKVCDYHDQFEFLLGRVELSEEYVVSFFLNGLKNVIQQSVKMFMPKTLSQAYALAHLQETTLKTLQQELNLNHKKPYPLLTTPNYQSRISSSSPLLPTPRYPPKPQPKNTYIHNNSNHNPTFNTSRIRPIIDFDD